MESMNIFPFIEVNEEEEEDIEELPMAKEYAWDFQNNDFRYRNGKMYLVEGKEAVKVWLWKLFKTNRFRELIYSWDYGSELESLIGLGYTQGYLNSESERYVYEAVEYNLEGYVTDVKNIDVQFNNGELTISGIVDTIYGEVELVE